MDKEQLEEMVFTLFDIIGSEKFSKRLAEVSKTMFDELLLAGFKRDEAIELICNFGKTK